MKFSTLIEEYKKAIDGGDSIEVMNRFYGDDIIQIENNQPPVKGKEKLLELENASIARVHSFDLKIVSLVIDEAQQKVMGEMAVKFNSKSGGKKKFQEAFVQDWKDDKIIYQRFYYGVIEADKS